MKTAHGLWLVVTALILLGPNVAAVLGPFERWPWTSAPMFAASPVSNRLYRVDFLLEKADGTTAPLPTKEAAGLSEWHFRRSFLVQAWGSSDPAMPFGYVDDDTPAKREERVHRYVEAMVRQAKKKKKKTFSGAVALRIEATEKQTKQKQLLARYTFADRRLEQP